ncbi:S24/S26 family peptidase [Nocardioides taihuensis]|uniref:S24/S26 family peptidase n=1 Tax=Nocardioides taihuensis TaxID=1835606 RepID=A0ABW0BM38_9ACTN
MSHPTVPGSSYPSSRLPIGWARVRGDSMRPLLAPGDRLLVRYGARVRAGDVVVARFADGTVAVKRATERRTTRDGRPAWWLLSDDPEVGVDSRHRGPVADADVLAVVLARVWPRPTRLRRGAAPQP